jgi:hypothetical protein
MPSGLAGLQFAVGGEALMPLVSPRAAPAFGGVPAAASGGFGGFGASATAPRAFGGAGNEIITEAKGARMLLAPTTPQLQEPGPKAGQVKRVKSKRQHGRPKSQCKDGAGRSASVAKRAARG